MAIKRKRDNGEQPKERPETNGPEGRGQRQPELSRQELERLRERLRKKFH